MSFLESYDVHHRQTYGTAYVFYTEHEALIFAEAKRRSLKGRVLAPVEGHHRHAPEIKRWRVVILAQAKRERAA